MKLILDEREASLYDKCLTNVNPSIVLSKKVLLLGDALITTDDDRELLLIERKSLHDLLASIKDGRYEEQSYRLQHSSGILPHHIIYIIEGMFSQLRNPSEKKMIYSAMTSLGVIKGFSVIRTSSVQETAEWLLSTTDKLNRDLIKGKTMWIPANLSTSSTNANSNSEIDIDTNQNKEPAEYCSVVKKSKKENITPENWGEIVLCQIPGISSVSAVAVMKHFRSISHLIQELQSRPECLDTITCESKGKSRKLGRNVIDNIRSFLLHSSTV